MKSSLSAGYTVECVNLVYHPTGQPQNILLDDISFSVDPGEFFGIVGDNGAGKSTLLSAIAGEVRPVSGQVRIAGQRIDRPATCQIDGIGIVHQDTSSDFHEFESIARNIAFRQHNNSCHPNNLFACDISFKRKIGMDVGRYAPRLNQDINKLVGHLNGGSRQILSLLLSIRLEHRNEACSLLLLDEHTAGLDRKNSSEVMKFTVDHARSIKATVIMASHSLQHVVEHCDKVLIMDRGRARGPYDKGQFLTVDALIGLIDNNGDIDMRRAG